MDNMRYRIGPGVQGSAALAIPERSVTSTDWRHGLPTLAGSLVRIRPLHSCDAAALFSMIGSDEVTRFIAPPPGSVAGFEKFIACANRERDAGTGFAFAIVPEGTEVAVGLIQVRQLDPNLETAEWGFAMGSAFWGTGIFLDAARLVLQFAFESVGIHRMEARSAAHNGRGNGALRKLGAIQEGVLRRAFQRGAERHDQVLWTILADEWQSVPSSSTFGTARIH